MLGICVENTRLLPAPMLLLTLIAYILCNSWDLGMQFDSLDRLEHNLYKDGDFEEFGAHFSTF